LNVAETVVYLGLAVDVFRFAAVAEIMQSKYFAQTHVVVRSALVPYIQTGTCVFYRLALFGVSLSAAAVVRITPAHKPDDITPISTNTHMFLGVAYPVNACANDL